MNSLTHAFWESDASRNALTMLYCNFHLEVLIVVLVLLLNVRGQEEKEVREITFHDIAPLDYDYLKPPKVEGNPVSVNISVSNLNIRSVDESHMSITVSVELWQYWKDHRLTYPAWAEGEYQVLDSSWISKLWHPNLYFPDAVDGKINNIITPSSFFWMTRGNVVYFCCRLVLKLICEMNLVYFPHDEQKCGVRMASAIFIDKEVVMDWWDFKGAIYQFSSLNQFEIVKIESNSCQAMLGHWNVSCLEKTVILRRRCGYHIINVYIPTVLIVIMSMLTFWIPPDAVPARITLGVTSLLTIITKQYQASMPSVSYIVGLNVWLSCCIAFVFSSLLEYAVVIGINKKTMKTNELEGPSDLVLPMVLLKANGTWATNQCWSKAKGKEKISNGKRLDIFSRIFFPVSFLIFVVSYWSYYS